MIRNLSKLILLATTLILFACGGGDEGVIGTGLDDELKVSGAAQKGPFILGTTILISELSEIGIETNKTIVTQTKDNLGNFEFTLGEPALLQLVASGYHFNEITGELSNSTLDLRAIYDASADQQQKAYINILTHAIHKRVITLLENGETSSDAITKAQSELIKALETVFPVTENLGDFTQYSLFDESVGNSFGNAYLLALSASFYQLAINKSESGNNIDAELSLSLNSFANDLSENGKIDNQNIISDLENASREVNVKIVEMNLQKLLKEETEETKTLPDMNLVLDSDGDGVVNHEDEDANGDGVADVKAKNMFSTALGKQDAKIYINEIQETAESNYVAIGYELIETSLSFEERPFILEIDKDGYITNNKQLEIDGPFSIKDFVQSENGNLVIIGLHDSNDDPSETELLVVEVDQNNNINWQYAIKETEHIYKINDIIKLVDGYVISSVYKSSSFIIKLSKSGELDWQLNLKDENENIDSISSIGVDSEGNLRLVGHAKTTINFESAEEAVNNGHYGFELIEIDGKEVAAVEVSAVYTASIDSSGINFHYVIHSLLLENTDMLSSANLSDGSFIITIHDTENVNLAKISSAHEPIWEKHVPELQSNYFPPMPLEESGFAFLGNYDFGLDVENPDRGFLFSKFDENGGLIGEPKRVHIQYPDIDANHIYFNMSSIKSSSLTSNGGLLILADEIVPAVHVPFGPPVRDERLPFVTKTNSEGETLNSLMRK